VFQWLEEGNKTKMFKKEFIMTSLSAKMCYPESYTRD
jgi:hypothetical protein